MPDHFYFFLNFIHLPHNQKSGTSVNESMSDLVKFMTAQRVGNGCIIIV